MPPQVIPQQPNAGVASIQQGLAAVQQLGQFLEQKRQFEEDQKRLNNLQQANWGWTATQELIKTTDRQSIKEVAAKYPSMLSLIFQRGLGIDESTAMPFITALAQSPDNAIETMNRVFSIYTRHGNGSMTGADSVKQETTAMEKTIAERQAQAETQGTGKQNAVPPTSTPKAPISMTPFPKTEGIAAEDPALTEFKAKIFSLASSVKNAQAGMSPQERQALDSLVGEYRNKSPQVEDFVNNGMSAYIGTAMGAKGTLAAEQLSRGKTVAQPPSTNYPNPPKTTSPTAGGEIPTPSKPPAQVAQPEAQSSDPVLASALKDFMEGSTGGRGRAMVVQKKLEGPMTTAIQAQMEATPGGIKQLVEDANFLMNDPQALRMAAIQQNAASVYATDQAGSGDTAMSKLEIGKKIIDFKRAEIDLQIAMTNLAKMGVEGKDAQYKAAVSGIMASMIQSGLVPPPEAANQMNALSDDLVTLREKWNAAKDTSTKQFLTDQIEQKNTQLQGIISAWKSAVGKANTPGALKAQKLLDAVFDPKNKNAWQNFWNVGNEVVRNWSTPKAQEAAKAREIPVGEAELRKAYHTTGQVQ